MSIVRSLVVSHLSLLTETSPITPACTHPSTTGYNFNNAGGTLTRSSFSPSGVICASGYAGSVLYSVCGTAGSAYSVSGCHESELGKVDDGW